MSVLIKGMEKPEHCGYCRFRYDGICHALQKTQYSMNECPLVVIDDAGLNDTISRQALLESIERISVKGNVLDDDWIYRFIQEFPSAERKEGRWLPVRGYGGGYWVCSSCKNPTEAFAADVLYKYCPFCGADMRGEQDDNN